MQTDYYWRYMTRHRMKDNSPELYKLLSTYTCGVAVVVDLRCAESHHIIKQASEQKLLSSLHHWLLLGDVNSTIDENINIPLNSHVVLATELKDDSSADIVLQEVYKLSTSWLLTYTPARVWLPGQPFPPSPSRDDFQGLVLRAAIVVMEDSWESHDDLRYKHLNTWSKLTYGPMKNVAKMLNFSMTETETESWGFLNPDGSFSGMVGLLQRNECDIGAVQCAITPGRRVAVEFAAEMVPFSFLANLNDEQCSVLTCVEDPYQSLMSR
uniref:Ionotropic receptor 75a N-terminal domain-containing protein n=1 Tax=Timema shepardi TaxID=629360 RepID=A0A7R9B815_TIMSH|nr:unnamed protein product [Timema shepardi]